MKANENARNNEATKINLDKSRRTFAKAGVVGPVIMSVMGRPAFGAQCLSNMLSGNLSDPNRGNDCWGGMSPGFWKTPAGKPDGATDKGDDWEWAWGLTGYKYYDTAKYNPKKWEDYMGGTNVLSLFFMAGVSVSGMDYDKDGYVSIREYLNQTNNSDGNKHLIAGWLNIKYFSAIGVAYFIKESDFIAMVDSDRQGLANLIASNYHNNPI
ncbi:hypothetical protein [Methylomonas methanica]|uniref:EF-hand domain-containing protein n=1 Tax=Methylomonas methanica (strain DSM 25384 / MC09) TaxID=857087 RepID=F9ZY30_METMM|nr:hypothetical protein [Methylomonas methanica]AEF99760.1 hypothetical protein Metme_1337 [Methylomonas methanica MC09]